MVQYTWTLTVALVGIDEDEDEDDYDVYYPGLVNVSGTYCFLNSVLQAMASLAYLEPHLDAIQAKAIELDVPTPVVDTLKETLQSEHLFLSLTPLYTLSVTSRGEAAFEKRY